MRRMAGSVSPVSLPAPPAPPAIPAVFVPQDTRGPPAPSWPPGARRRPAYTAVSALTLLTVDICVSVRTRATVETTVTWRTTAVRARPAAMGQLVLVSYIALLGSMIQTL